METTMKRNILRVSVLGLLLAFVTTAPNKEDWDIYSFHINSTVISRYATTVITSRVVNRMDQPKEIEFHVKIPKNAFISKFRMLIEGQMYDGVVKAKEEAEQQYAEAVSRGQSAGLVSSVGRTLEEFKTSVTVAALQKVTFELTYEELLKRKLGKYELLIHARPMQPVKDFKIDVYIQEKPGINFLDVKGGLSTKALANAVTKTHAHNQAWVYFYPTVRQQTQCDSCGEQGMNGDLVIVYDVNRNNLLGDIKGSDGYFVHHFAPSDLPRIPKNVVFIIDQSGSMRGKKIQQTREALLQILGDLAEDDYFGLITFNRYISPWRTELLRANEDNVKAAKNHAQYIRSGGDTDINAAVLRGTEMLNQTPREGSASLLILLTDGDPTTGVTDMTQIRRIVKEAISKKFPLYCLGFGFNVKFEFLEKMALENNGVARRIYEHEDASSQLKGFYEEVATPLLTDVMMVYVGGTNLTQTNFSQYYNGSEIVVAGRITDNNIETFTPQVVAISKGKQMEFSDTNVSVEFTGNISDSHIRRVWAYLTVKQLLEKELQLSGDEKQRVKTEALELSLRYSFVTPLTSMVVTKPPGESTQVAHKPKEGEEPLGGGAHVAAGIGFGVSGPRSAAPPGPIFPAGIMPGGAYGGHVHDVEHFQIQAPPGPLLPAGIMPDVAYGRHVQAPPGPLLPAGIMPDVAYGRHVQVPPAEPLLPAGVMPGFSYGRHVQVPPAGPLFTPGIMPGVAYGVPPFHRFLLGAEGQARPLCYDMPALPWRLSLLQDPNTGLYVNGEMSSSAGGGFRRIAIHFTNDQHVEIDTTMIIFSDGHNVRAHAWQQDLTMADKDNVTLILRNMEVDVTIGNTRMVILLHERNGGSFLWPVLRQSPPGNNIDGLLTVKPVAYTEVQGSFSRKLRINNQEVQATRISAVDYSINSAPTLDCWLMSLPSVLRRELSDFFVIRL